MEYELRKEFTILQKDGKFFVIHNATDICSVAYRDRETAELVVRRIGMDMDKAYREMLVARLQEGSAV